MRIISRYHDYYDMIQTYGQDQSLIYNRVIDQIWLDMSKYENKSNPILSSIYEAMYIFSRNRDDFKTDFEIIGFCGRLYLMLHCRESKKDSYKWKSIKFPSQLQINGGRHAKEEINKFFDETLKDNFFQYLFINNKVPIYTIRMDSRDPALVIEVNSILAGYNFQSIINPFDTYQEISMYLGGVIGKPNCCEQGISDGDMKYKKGFDDMSFKKYPIKKRK